MSYRQRVFSRSIREMTDVTNSVLTNHPLPDQMDQQNLPIQESIYNQWNYGIEDVFERCVSSLPHMSKREASYGSLLSILSGNSSHTISTCSFDEEPEGNSAHVLSKLERVDNLLYDGECSKNMNEKLKEDCLTWSKMFPHFRIKGTCLPLQPYSENCEAQTLEIENDCGMPETIAEHGDSVDCVSLNSGSNKEEDVALIKRIQEKVLAKLVDHLVAVTLEWRAATSEENAKPLRVRTATASRDRAQMRPMTALESQRSILPPVLPTTFRPLDGILVVSSKVLQNRRTFNYLSRPGSSVTRVKTADQGSSRAQILKSRLSKLSNNLEDIEEGKSLPGNAPVVTVDTNLHLRLSQTSAAQDRFGFSQDRGDPKETKNWDRLLSLPPVYPAAKEQTKYMKKTPPIQKLVASRQRLQAHQIVSRPPSGRDFTRHNFGEADLLTFQKTLPVLNEENNFLKIRPLMKTSKHTKSRPTSLHPLSARNRRT